MRTTDIAVEIEFTERMLGTVPMDKEIYSTYIATKKENGIDETEVDTVEDKLDEKGWTGFHRDEEKGIFIYDYMVVGMLKNAGNILKDQLGIKNLRSKIGNLVIVEPRRIYFGKEKADGAFERPLRVQTPQGQRVALAKSDYIETGTQISFTISILDNKEIDSDLIRELLEFGKRQGLGQFRGGSYGRFKVKTFSVTGA